MGWGSNIKQRIQTAKRGQGFMEPGSLYGEDYDTWMSRLGMDDETMEDMIDRMIRNVGSQGEMFQNRVGESVAQYDLPVSAEMALRRGGDITSQKTISEGTQDIEQFGEGMNRQAWSNILGMKSGQVGQGIGMMQFQQQMDLQRDLSDQDFWAQILQGIGGAAPYLLL